MLLPPSPTPNKNLSLSHTHTLSFSLYSLSLSLLRAELKMKQNFHSVGLLLFLVFLLVNTSETSARKLASKEGETNLKIDYIISRQKSVVGTENIESFTNLMGLEECEKEEEECLKRRALAEAHLDYIYTQHHKP